VQLIHAILLHWEGDGWLTLRLR